MFSLGILTILLTFYCILIKCSENDLKILNEIQKANDNFEIGNQKDIVLMLGKTGSGKSTLASLITGAELEAKRVGSGVFQILDKNHKISRDSTTVSNTKVPNLMFDNETNTTFYDCPGFSDTRGVVIDITATRSIHKLLNFANKIKLVFAASHQSVEKAYADRKDFTDLAGHAVNLIKNIDKYSKSIGLVVTKVHKSEDYNDKGEKFVVDDAETIKLIAEFLMQVKIDLENKRADIMTDEERRLNEEKIKFTDIFLERKSNKYTKINILRLAHRPGKLKDFVEIQNEKVAIQTMINYYLEYVPTNSSDFGYSISDQSMNQISNLITKLEDLDNFSDKICIDLKSFYKNQRPLINSVNTIKSTIGVENFFKLKSNMEFIKKFRKAVVDLGIEINADVLKNATKNFEFLDFLQSISKNQSTTISSQIKNKFKNCANKLFDEEVKGQLRIDVPNAILDIHMNYIKERYADVQIPNKLKSFLSATLYTCEVNSTELRSLLNLSSGQQNFSRTMEFTDFLQMLNDRNCVI